MSGARRVRSTRSFPCAATSRAAARCRRPGAPSAPRWKSAVQAALDTSRSPPEIAYAIGGIVHNYFRTRGVTLTSYELRRLVGELLALRQRAEPGAPLVAFTAEPAAAETSWTGDEPGTPGPVVPDVVFEGPPSPLVDVAPRDGDAALLAAVTAKARALLATTSEGRLRAPGRRRCDRGGARRAPARRAGKARAPGAAGLERALRHGPARPDLGRPLGPRGVREWAGGHLCRTQWRDRAVAGAISRPGASVGGRRPPGATLIVGRRHAAPARRRGGHGDLSAGRAGGPDPGAAPRRAGQRNLRASDRRADARSTDGRTAAHCRVVPPERVRRRPGGFGQDRAAGRPGARPFKAACAGRDPGASSRVSLAAGFEGRIGRAVGRSLCAPCWQRLRGCGRTC